MSEGLDGVKAMTRSLDQDTGTHLRHLGALVLDQPLLRQGLLGVDLESLGEGLSSLARSGFQGDPRHLLVGER